MTRCIRVKRIYETRSADDGMRVLVDRLWPRGVSRDDAKLDAWARELAPSTSLRRWFSHDPARFDEFKVRYLVELQARRNELSQLLRQSAGQPITLLYAARDPKINHAVVLQDALLRIK